MLEVGHSARCACQSLQVSPGRKSSHERRGSAACNRRQGRQAENILIPADLAAALRELRGDAPDRLGYSRSLSVASITSSKATARRAGIDAAVSAHSAAARPCKPRYRRGRTDHARVSDARARGSQSNVRVCARPAGRQLKPVSQKDLISIETRCRIRPVSGVKRTCRVNAQLVCL